MLIKLVKNRQGDMIPFDVERIRIAIRKAYEATETLLDDVDFVVEQVIEDLVCVHQDEELVCLEHIQDVVEKQLMKAEKYDAAKQYIIYRQKHNEERKKERETIKEKFEHHQLKVVKDDGSWEFFDINKIR